jgi:hypothetical protein
MSEKITAYELGDRLIDLANDVRDGRTLTASEELFELGEDLKNGALAAEDRRTTQLLEQCDREDAFPYGVTPSNESAAWELAVSEVRAYYPTSTFPEHSDSPDAARARLARGLCDRIKERAAEIRREKAGKGNGYLHTREIRGTLKGVLDNS